MLLEVMNIKNDILIIDCSSSGIAGDMILAALLGLGASFERIKHIAESIEQKVSSVRKIDIKLEDTLRGGIRSKLLRVKIDEEKVHHVHGIDLLNYVKEVSEDIGLSSEARDLAVKIVKTILEAEAKVHGEDIEEVHLHETGSADTIIDIVGTVSALEDLGFINGEVYATPLALGGGRIKFSHGISSVPAPATIEILKRRSVPVIGGPVNYELTTPTGAAILVNIVKHFVMYYPVIRILKISYGAGVRDIPGFINAIRIILGEKEESVGHDCVVVLETNVDDVTGEMLGYLSQKLMKMGAKDVTFIPAYMKKGRPGYIIKVIADIENSQSLAKVIMEETGTLGIRISKVDRYIIPERDKERVAVEIDNRKYDVDLKVSRDLQNRIIIVKPEYESIKKVAIKSGKPLRYVFSYVLHKWMELKEM